MTFATTLQTFFENAQVENERSIALIQEQIQKLNEFIERKKRIEAKRDRELYEDSIRLFMKGFLALTKEEQTEVLDSFQREMNQDVCNIELGNSIVTAEIQTQKISSEEDVKTNSQEYNQSSSDSSRSITNEEKPKKRRGKAAKKESVSDSSLTPDVEDSTNLSNSENEQDDYQIVPSIPDVSEGDSVTDVGQCFITKKAEFDDDEYRKIILPVLSDQIVVNHESGRTLQIFGRDYPNIELSGSEEFVLAYLLTVGSFGIKESASVMSYQTPQNTDDSYIRHDLWVIAIESLRKKLLQATNGAIQLEYYIYRDDIYPYDDYIPYEAVSVRLRKAGPLDSKQEKEYLSLYESAKKSYSGT